MKVFKYMNSRLNMCLFKSPSTYPFNVFSKRCIRLQLPENFEEQTTNITVDSKELLHMQCDDSVPHLKLQRKSDAAPEIKHSPELSLPVTPACLPKGPAVTAHFLLKNPQIS